MSEITSKLLILVTEKGCSKLQAWNETSQQLITTAKVYINIYVFNCFIDAINRHQVASNQQALIELFELFLLYGLCDIFAANFLRVSFECLSSFSFTKEFKFLIYFK